MIDTGDMAITKLTLKSEDGALTCHSCLESTSAPHIEIWDWARYLCITCAETLGSKLMALAAIRKPQNDEDVSHTQRDMFGGV